MVDEKDTILQDIADAIREKDGTTNTMYFREMADRIRAIPTGGGDLPPEEPDKSYIYLYVPDPPYNTYTFGFWATRSSSGFVDWGDGVYEEIHKNNSARDIVPFQMTHTFSKTGLVRITLIPNPSITIGAESTAGGSGFIRPDETTSVAALTGYEGMVLRVVFRTGIVCSSEQYNAQVFRDFHIQHIEIGQTLYPYSTFGSVSCPNITFTNSVISFTRAGFNIAKCRSLDFSNNTVVPSIASNTFNNAVIQEIIVPDSLYDDWIVATNWADKASIIVKKSESRKYGGST